MQTPLVRSAFFVERERGGGGGIQKGCGRYPVIGWVRSRGRVVVWSCGRMHLRLNVLACNGMVQSDVGSSMRVGSSGRVGSSARVGSSGRVGLREGGVTLL